MTKSPSLFAFSAVLLSLFLTVSAFCAPAQPEDFTVQNGGFVDLPLGSFVEGSSRFGGLQPDYQIDDNPELLQFLESVKKAANMSPKIAWWNVFARFKQKPELSHSSKIELVTAMIQNALPNYSYDSAPYLKVLAEHRAQNIDINLATYLKCQAGVCREHALLTHLALKAVGIQNQFVYIHARVETSHEDHALVVIEQDGEKWIVDPYNPAFHGRSFNDLMAADAIEYPRQRGAAYAPHRIYEPVQIESINLFPRYWLPKLFCSKMF
ncbi:hypothetical protein CIK05_11905 [Bdellovibrio sp. qaytius]|nr:hypothetical protein CIK05_11905 [Bdellovibrio sp. qaytius]